MKTFFLDTGYLIALEAADDQYHAIALQHWRSLLPSLPQFITTAYVFDEVVTFFNSRQRHAKAVEIGNRLINSPSIQLLQVDEIVFYEAWRYFEQHHDKLYSLTDCISFVVMKQLDIQTAFTFDRHFTQAGFEKFP